MEDLPVGAKYDERQGRASVSIEKEEDQTYTITANCDSLLILITERESEIYHLQKRIRELEETTTETVVIKEPKPVQWFLIYSGGLLWIMAGIGLIRTLIKRKWKRLL